MTRSKKTTVLLAFCITMVFTLGIKQTSAQCEEVRTLKSAGGLEGSSRISLNFDYSTKFETVHKDLAAKVKKPENWMVFSPTLILKARSADPKDQSRLFAEANPVVKSITINSARGVDIDISVPLQKSETYMINVAPGNDIIPAGCVGNSLSVNLAAATTTSGTVSPKPPKVVFVTVEKRADADIYAEGIMEGAHKEKTGFTIDASVSKKFSLGKAELADAWWKPFFNLKASTKDDADPDSLNFGVNLAKAFGTSNEFNGGGKFEADRDFKAVNLVGEARAAFSPASVNDRCRRILTKPCNLTFFAGLEIGKNLDNPVLAVKGRMIARPIIGGNLYVAFYQQEKATGEFKRTLYLETLYERRFMLKQEIALDEDEDGNLVGVKVGKFPRDYINSSLTYDFARYFGFKVTYEYGSLPPLFKLVDHKFSAGLVFKGKFGRK